MGYLLWISAVVVYHDVQWSQVVTLLGKTQRFAQQHIWHLLKKSVAILRTWLVNDEELALEGLFLWSGWLITCERNAAGACICRGLGIGELDCAICQRFPTKNSGWWFQVFCNFVANHPETILEDDNLIWVGGFQPCLMMISLTCAALGPATWQPPT